MSSYRLPWCFCALVMKLSMGWSEFAHAEIITHLPTTQKVVALTLDACEAPNAPRYLDRLILAALDREKVPFTLFVTGLFAQRNAAELSELAHSPLVEIESHSYSHPAHFETLNRHQMQRQLMEAHEVIGRVTGKAPRFFRFPGGNYDAASLRYVEAAGYRVVHWRWPTGDPSPTLKPADLSQWVLYKTKPGDILIFHINGLAPATHTALPQIIAELRRRGYSFVRLDEMLP